MTLRNLGHGRYQIVPSGWTVVRDTWDSTNIWTVYDALGFERLYRSTRKEAVEAAVEMMSVQLYTEPVYT